MTTEKEFLDEEKEYHIHSKINQSEPFHGPLKIMWFIEIDLPNNKSPIKCSGSAQTVDSARQKIKDIIKFFLMNEI